MLEVDEATNTAVAKASITYTADKQIKWIHIMLNGENIESQTPTFDVSCAITPINEDVGTNSRLTIHKTVENSSELLEVLPKTYFTYVESGCDLVGIGQYYFGARYYDPELGVWGSCDKAGQFYNAYGYGNDPVLFVDPDGRWGLAHIFMSFGQEYFHQKLQSFKEIGDGLKDIGKGIAAGYEKLNIIDKLWGLQSGNAWGALMANLDYGSIGDGVVSLYAGASRYNNSKIEATGVAAYSMVPDLENWAWNTHKHTMFAQFLRWAGVGAGGGEDGAHGGQYDFDKYIDRYQDNVHSSNPFKRWRAKGHIAHTTQDAHIHRDKEIQGTWKEALIEVNDWRYQIWIPEMFYIWSDYEANVYGK